VERTRQAQTELKDQIECLSADLKRVAEEQSCPVDLGRADLVYLFALRIHFTYLKVPVLSHGTDGGVESGSFDPS